MACKQTDAAHLTARETLILRLTDVLTVCPFITLFATVASAFSHRVMTIATSTFSLILVLGMMFVPELRDTPTKEQLRSLPFMATGALLLSSLQMLCFSQGLHTSTPGYLKYINIALLILLVVFFWRRCEEYRNSVLRFLALTASLAMFSFSLIVGLNCALDTSAPAEVQATIVEMNVSSPRRLGQSINHTAVLQAGDDQIGVSMTIEEFGRYTVGDTIPVMRHAGAFNMPYFEYLPR